MRLCWSICSLWILTLQLHAGQKFKVEIISTENLRTSLTRTIPGTSTSTTSGNANCSGIGNVANCSSSSTTRKTETAPARVDYDLNGANLALKLPDGRIALVACTTKYSWSNTSGVRSCRIPPITVLEADFGGDEATLKWPVSLDGKKSQSETYKVLGVMSLAEFESKAHGNDNAAALLR